MEADSTNALEIAKRFFLPSEYKKIISLSDTLRGQQFLIYWTLKESYFKLTGAKNFLQADCEKILAGNGNIIKTVNPFSYTSLEDYRQTVAQMTEAAWQKKLSQIMAEPLDLHDGRLFRFDLV